LHFSQIDFSQKGTSSQKSFSIKRKMHIAFTIPGIKKSLPEKPAGIIIKDLFIR